MANPVNYTTTTTSLIVNTNSTINQASDNFIKMILNPLLGFTLTKEDLTIGGTTGTNWEESNLPDISDAVEVSAWDDGLLTGVVTALPIGVTSVLMFNLDSTVIVYAYLDPNYNISTQNINIVLDIDGDAQPVVIPTPSNQFQIHVELTGANPNAKVFSIIPNGTNYYYDNVPQSWLLKPVDPYGNNTKASVICNYTWPNVTNAQDSARLMWPGDNSPKQMFFVIIPDDGYYLSRNNFYPPSTWCDLDCILGANNIASDQVPLDIVYASSPSNPLTNLEPHIYQDDVWVEGWLAGANLNGTEAEGLIPSIQPQEPYHPYTGYGGTGPTSTYGNVFFDYGGETVSATTLYNGGSNSGQYGVNSQVSLIDSKIQGISGGAITDWEDVPYPYNLVVGQCPNPFNSEPQNDFLDGVPIADYCANDWVLNIASNPKNVVFVALQGIANHVPGGSPSDITLKLSGQAMPENGDCTDVTINIESPLQAD